MDYNSGMNRKTDITLFVAVLMDCFKLEQTPIITSKKSIVLDGADCWGVWYYSRKQHKIWVSSGKEVTTQKLFTILAHEFVHAWQHENNMPYDHDSKEFLAMIDYFGYNYGVNIVSMKDS